MRYDLGFLGGGQLARMSIQAAQRMGLKCLSLDPGNDTPASQVADAIVGKLHDVRAIAEIMISCEKITLENEFIPAEAIREALAVCGRGSDCLIPGADTLEVIQDKLHQREAYAAAGVPSPRAVPIEGGLPDMAFPMVLKARFGGYDGKGTRYARTEDEFYSYRDLWRGGGWMAEEFVPFKRELAAMVAVSADETRVFPTVETIQTNHVCDLVFPAEVDASDIALAAVRAVKGLGLFGVELFETQDGKVLVNEIAPRPHNTGHYTLDWGATSQFEQHVRLVMGWPLGDVDGRPTCMANLLGQPVAQSLQSGIRQAMTGDSGVHVHWYGKVEAKPGRKMGHLNVVGENVVERAIRARDRFYAGWAQS